MWQHIHASLARCEVQRVVVLVCALIATARARCCCQPVHRQPARLPCSPSRDPLLHHHTQHLHKKQNGWDALVARWPMLAMWVPAWSGALARSLLQALGSELLQRGERPVVFWCFSGAAKVCCEMCCAAVDTESLVARHQTPQPSVC